MEFAAPVKLERGPIPDVVLPGPKEATDHKANKDSKEPSRETARQGTPSKKAACSRLDPLAR